MSTRRPKSVLDQERYTAELSTGQLVIGVCILLMFGLGCFLLGVLIGKFDPTLKTASEQRTGASPIEAPAPEIKVSELPAVAAPANPPVSEPVLPPEMRVPANILKDDPAPNPQSAAPAAPSAEPAATPTPDRAASTPPATETASPPPAAVETPGVSESVAATAERNRIAPPSTPPQTVETAAAPAATPANTSEPAAAETSPSLAPWKGYGVQILAVAKDRAEGARKDLESKSSYKARVLPHARNDLYRVVVGPYADQATAARARDDLRARGYKDAFVLTIQ